MASQTKIKWVNSSQTLLKINNRVINLASTTQIILDEDLSESEPPHVTFYFAAPIGNYLEPNNVPSWPESDAASWWLTYSGEEAEEIRKFFGYSIEDEDHEDLK